jgi:hypothetical protein
VDSVKRFPFLEVMAVGTLLLAIALPRGIALGRFLTPDEYKWIARSANFYQALSSGNFASTIQVGHPGVTVMWAGTLAYLATFPQYASLQTGQVTADGFHVFMQENQMPVTPLELLRNSRIVMVILHVTILIISYLYARRLLGAWPALVGFLMIAIDPFHIGLTRLLHLDGLAANFMLLATLAFLAYLFHGQLIDLLVSGAAAALGFLTRSPAIAMVPIIGLLALWRPWQALRQHKLTLKVVWQALWTVLVWLLVGVVTVFIVWPAMWVNPLQTISQVFTIAEEYAVEGHASPVFFNGEVIPHGDMGLRYFYFYPLTYLWRVTPIVLIGLALAIWGYGTRHAPFDNSQTRLTVNGLLLMSVVFAILMTFGEKKFDRYLLPIYPALDLIAGLGWYALFRQLMKNRWRGVLHYAPLLAAAALILIQMGDSLRTFPYYLSYYNPLLGGSLKAPQVMQIGWGEGLDQAAEYLNQKPNGEKLKVAAWYPEGCFSYFFEGNNRPMEYTTDTTSDLWQRFTTADYAVVYISQWQRRFPEPVLEYVSHLAPEHTIWIDGLEYAHIYKLK